MGGTQIHEEVSQMTARNRKSMVGPFADVVGFTGSVLCALHCLIVPVALVSGMIEPISRLDDQTFHLVLLWAVVPAAVIAFGFGCREHKDRWVFALGAVGLVTMTASFTILHEAIGESGERIAAMFASTLLIAAHLRNWHLCRLGACGHDCVKSARR